MLPFEPIRLPAMCGLFFMEANLNQCSNQAIAQQETEPTPNRVRLKYRDASGFKVTRWGIWSSAWAAVDWALSQGAMGASATILNKESTHGHEPIAMGT